MAHRGAGRKPASAQSVPGALDAIILDEAWQSTLSDRERSTLVEWSQRYLSGSFEGALLHVRAKLAELNRLPAGDERSAAIRALVDGHHAD